MPLVSESCDAWPMAVANDFWTTMWVILSGRALARCDASIDVFAGRVGAAVVD